MSVAPVVHDTDSALKGSKSEKLSRSDAFLTAAPSSVTCKFNPALQELASRLSNKTRLFTLNND
jgi:hypothetical protein